MPGLSWSPIACAQGNGDVEVNVRTIPDSAHCFWLLSRLRAAVPTHRWYTHVQMTVLGLYYLEHCYIPEYSHMFPSASHRHGILIEIYPSTSSASPCQQALPSNRQQGPRLSLPRPLAIPATGSAPKRILSEMRTSAWRSTYRT